MIKVIELFVYCIVENINDLPKWNLIIVKFIEKKNNLIKKSN